MNEHIPVASVHGRFQPLHLEHMEYIMAAFDRAQYLYVGVTQFRRSRLKSMSGAGAHREELSANPLTYFERVELISRAIKGEGIGPERYRVLPFPIETPAELPDYLPLQVPILSTRVDEWNDEKARLLRGVGYEVHMLFERDPKGISGSEIRSLIAKKDHRWADMVPDPTVQYLESLDLSGRLDGDS